MFVVASKRKGSAGRFLVYNVVNPETTTWDALLPAFKAIGPLTVVSAAEWIDRLERSDKGSHVIRENPAAKIIDFYKQIMVDNKTTAKVETGNLLQASETAASLSPVKEEHMTRWIQG